MSIGNYINVKNVNATGLSNNVQNGVSNQLAKAREGNADNFGNQASDSNQTATAPNDINATISRSRLRSPYTTDLIDVRNINAGSSADSLQNQGQTQKSEVGSPYASYGPYAYGSASNGSWQSQNAAQDVDSYNNILTRIDQPRMEEDGQPGAEIYVNNIGSVGTGRNVQVQDLVQDALVKKTPRPTPYCPPLRPGGHATNEGEQVQNNGQDIDSRNTVDVIENISGRPRYYQADPSVTNLASTAVGDNVQAQSTAQTALDAARSTGGTHAGNSLFGSQSNDQDVDSSNLVGVTVNDRVNSSQTILANRIDSTGVASNLQDSASSQSAESAFRGSASNSDVLGQWNGQNVTSGNWINTSM